MAYYIEIPDTAPYPVEAGMCAAVFAKPIPVPAEPAKPFCACFSACAKSEPAFYSDSGDELENDRTQYLFSRILDTDTINASLYKNGVKMGDVSGAYGTLWDGFDSNPLYYGFEIEWRKAAALHGAGRYMVKIKFNLAGAEYETESRIFAVQPYSPYAAHKTVRVEAYHTGSIASEQADFTGLRAGGWAQWVRVPGWFGDKKPVLEQDRYENPQYESVQIIDRITAEYELRTGFVGAETANSLFYGMMLANRLLITDYNLTNSEKLARVDVIPAEPSETQHAAQAVRQSWRFRERKADTVKTNF